MCKTKTRDRVSDLQFPIAVIKSLVVIFFPNVEVSVFLGVSSSEHDLATRIVGSFEHTRTMSVFLKSECGSSVTGGCLLWNVVVT